MCVCVCVCVCSPDFCDLVEFAKHPTNFSVLCVYAAGYSCDGQSEGEGRGGEEWGERGGVEWGREEWGGEGRSGGVGRSGEGKGVEWRGG